MIAEILTGILILLMVSVLYYFGCLFFETMEKISCQKDKMTKSNIAVEIKELGQEISLTGKYSESYGEASQFIVGIILFSLIIAVVMWFKGPTGPDIYHNNECGSFVGVERDYCIQQIDEQRQAEEDYYKSKEIRNLP